MIGHRLATIFDSSRASPSNSIFLRQKWWPICGQSIWTPSKQCLIQMWFLSRNFRWLATDWPPFLTPPGRVLVTAYFWSKNGGQSVANQFDLHQSNVLYTCDSWVENNHDWPLIGHHFCLKNMLLLGLALEESKMVANLWPIILNSIKAMSYIDVILE